MDPGRAASLQGGSLGSPVRPPGAGERPSFCAYAHDGPLAHPETLEASGASEKRAGESTDGTEHSMAGFPSSLD